jgi:hypothetical protein
LSHIWGADAEARGAASALLPLILILATISTGCGGWLPKDDALIHRFQTKKASWERLRQIAYEDLQECREWAARAPNVVCPSLQSMPASRYAAFSSAAQEVGVQVDQIRFFPFIFNLEASRTTLDYCLEVVVSDTGFPIKTKQKAILFCETDVPLRMRCSDLDECARDQSRKMPYGAFRHIEGGWYLWYTPL